LQVWALIHTLKELQQAVQKKRRSSKSKWNFLEKV
jgi:hypothetical protein